MSSQETNGGPLPSQGRRDYLWLALMSLMLFVLLIPIASYVAALPTIQDEWGLNNTQAGLVFSAYLAGYALSALLLVPLTDRIPPRNILLGSAAVSVVAHLLFPVIADDIASAVILRGIAGVGFVGVYVPGLRIVAERFRGDGRGASMGLFVTAQYGANSASLVLSGALMAVMEWRDAYLTVSLISAASLPLAVFLLRGTRPVAGRVATGRLDLKALRNPPVRYLILGYSLHAWQLYAVRTWFPLFLLAVLVAGGADRVDAAPVAATIAGLALASGSVGPLMGGFLSDRMGRATSASAIFALSGACSWGIGWTVGWPWGVIVLIGVVYGWATAADSAIYQTGITEVASRDQLGSTMAMQAFLGLAGGVVGPIVFGGVLDLAPEAYEWGLAFSGLGILAVIAILGMRRLRGLPQSQLLAAGKG